MHWYLNDVWIESKQRFETNEKKKLIQKCTCYLQSNFGSQSKWLNKYRISMQVPGVQQPSKDSLCVHIRITSNIFLHVWWKFKYLGKWSASEDDEKFKQEDDGKFGLKSFGVFW